MNANFVLTKDYEDKPRLWAPGKQTQSKPNKANLKRMNVNFCATGYYESKLTFAVRKGRLNNPNVDDHHLLNVCCDGSVCKNIRLQSCVSGDRKRLAGRGLDEQQRFLDFARMSVLTETETLKFWTIFTAMLKLIGLGVTMLFAYMLSMA